MKRKLIIVLLITLLFTLCGCEKKNVLDGVYKTETFASEMSYEFDKENNVQFKFILAGYVAVSKKGTYEINEDKTEITLAFEENDDDVSMLPSDVSNLSGIFNYSEGDGYIQIGKMQYNKVVSE